MQLDFLEPTERASKEDDKSITFQLWNGKSIRFIAAVTTFKGFKVWTQDCSKEKLLKQTNGQLDVDFTYRS